MNESNVQPKAAKSAAVLQVAAAEVPPARAIALTVAAQAAAATTAAAAACDPGITGRRVFSRPSSINRRKEPL